jgi:ABC-type transporter Mla MlaB component
MADKAIWERDGAAGLRLRGDWRLDALDQTLRRDAKILLRQPWTQLSLAEDTEVDSSTLAFLLDWQSAQRALGSPATVLHPPPALEALLQLYGLEGIWRLSTT